MTTDSTTTFTGETAKVIFLLMIVTVLGTLFFHGLAVLFEGVGL